MNNTYVLDKFQYIQQLTAAPRGCCGCFLFIRFGFGGNLRQHNGTEDQNAANALGQGKNGIVDPA